MPFFNGQRRKLELVDYYPKLNAQGEKRFCVKFSMTLVDQSLVGMPGSIGAAYDCVAKIEHGIVEADIGVDVDGQTIECYASDEQRAPRMLLITAADLTKLCVSRKVSEDGPDDDVNLSFVTTVPGSRELNTWLYEQYGLSFFAEFSEAQPALDLHPMMTKENETLFSPVNGVTQSPEAAKAVSPEADKEFTKRAPGRPKGASKEVTQ